MRLSTKSRYGIKALIDLANLPENDPVSIKDIAGRQNISRRYLENIFNTLKKHGILNSTRGKGGGFHFAKPLEEIFLIEIIDILEEKTTLAECINETDTCNNTAFCNTRKIWIKLDNLVRDSLSGIKLSDLMNENFSI